MTALAVHNHARSVRPVSEAYTIGKRIRAVRQKAGLSLDRFAAAIGYSRRALVNWEQNAAEPPIGVLHKLRGLYNIDPEWGGLPATICRLDHDTVRPIGAALIASRAMLMRHARKWESTSNLECVPRSSVTCLMMIPTTMKATANSCEGRFAQSRWTGVHDPSS